MEIAVAGMSRDRIDQVLFILIQYRIHLRQDLRQIFRLHDEIVDERRGVPAGRVVTKLSACAAKAPAINKTRARETLFVILIISLFRST